MSHAPPVGPSRPVSFERERGVYHIAVNPDIGHVVVKVGSADDRTQRLQSIFQILADHQIPIFLIKLHRGAVTFAVEGARMHEVEDCLKGVAIDCSTRRNLAQISVVASSMRDLTGVMVSIADSLQRAGARLYGVGDSHNSVQCLVDGEHVRAALTELNDTFGLGEWHA
jgi:aspartokinase